MGTPASPAHNHTPSMREGQRAATDLLGLRDPIRRRDFDVGDGISRELRSQPHLVDVAVAQKQHHAVGPPPLEGGCIRMTYAGHKRLGRASQCFAEMYALREQRAATDFEREELGFRV